MKIANAVIDNNEIGDIKIIPAYNSNGEENGFYGVFDMSKLKYVPVIKLAVPEEEIGKVYGKGKQNKQYWEYCCGGKEIKLIPIKG